MIFESNCIKLRLAAAFGDTIETNVESKNVSPLQWLWLQTLKLKISQGKTINLNGSRTGRDSVEQLIEFVERLFKKLDQEQLLELMDECDRQDWIDFWKKQG